MLATGSAIFYGPCINLSGVLLPGLIYKCFSSSLARGWVGRHSPWRVGAAGQAVSGRQLKANKFIIRLKGCAFVCVYVSEWVYARVRACVCAVKLAFIAISYINFVK